VRSTLEGQFSLSFYNWLWSVELLDCLGSAGAHDGGMHTLASIQGFNMSKPSSVSLFQMNIRQGTHFVPQHL
jgi:hypothetical protein